MTGVIVTTGLVVACGGGNSSGEGAASSSAFITSFCDLLGTCCSKDQKTYDQQKCTQFYNGILGTGYTYDANNGQACLDKTRAEQNSPTFCSEGAQDDAICKKVFTKAGATGGTKQPGDLCSTDADCASQPDGTVNCSTFIENDATTKTCQLFVRAKAGEACGGDVEEDDDTPFASDKSARVGICHKTDSLYCDTFDTKKCTPYVPSGGTCEGFTSSKCVANNRCDPKTKKCTPLLADGADCEPVTTASDNPCAATSYCPKDSKKCAPAKKKGEACADATECGSAGCSGGKCGGSTTINLAPTIACK